MKPIPGALLIAAIIGTLGCATKPQPLASGIDLKGMDRSVAPGDDFNAYANGTWSKSTPIPPDKASYGTDAILADQTRSRIRDLIQNASNAGSDKKAAMVGDFYAAFMDEAGIEAKGLAPVKPQLDAIAAIKNRTDLSRAIGTQLRTDVDPLNNTNFETSNLFGVWITQGLDDPQHTYPYLLQGGLGMPERDYYLSTTAQMAALRKQYLAHIEAMFRIAGFSDPAGRAGRVFALETAMARVHATRTESEDVHTPVLWKRDDLTMKAPGLDWPALLDAAGLKDAPEIIIWHPKAIPALSALAAKEALDTWKDWLALHFIEHFASVLPKAFVEESFEFYGKALSGVQQMRPRWQRGIDLTSGSLGEAVGQMYVEKYFPPETKAKVQAMVGDLIQAFGKRIDALTWMAPETKAKAKQKLQTLKVGVGYPDQWTDYSGLVVKRDDAFGNAASVRLFEYRRQLAKLGKPVDRGEWWMTPQTVDAVNLPLQNALNFPAAIIQPPYFDATADAAHNYGSMGAIIGHEISHSFDDQGSQFDAQGKLANWWTKQDFDHFKAAAEALAAEFDAYHPFPDLAVNGHQTLSENIADVAGLSVAYDAYKLSLQGKADAVKDGFGGDQRFFISFAQSWRTKTREAALRAQIATDGHAPAEYRADTARNLDAWYGAFTVVPGQKLYLSPGNRVRVW